jgi:hypothetical protein
MGTDAPDWGDFGNVELKRADGPIVTGRLYIDDAFFDGESSHPLHVLELADGSKITPYDFDWWRVLGK